MFSFNFGHNGSNWVLGTSSPFTSNTILQQEHEMIIYFNKIANTVFVSIDGDILINNQSYDLSLLKNEFIVLGGIPLYSNPNTYYANSYISNFVVHPKGTDLATISGKQYKNPKKMYGKNSRWFLDEFGNFPYNELLGSAGGIIEEGQNSDGRWVRFESGLLIQCNFIISVTGEGTNITRVVNLPKSYSDNSYSILFNASDDTAVCNNFKCACAMRLNKSAIQCWLKRELNTSYGMYMYWCTIGY